MGRYFFVCSRPLGFRSISLCSRSNWFRLRSRIAPVRAAVPTMKAIRTRMCCSLAAARSLASRHNRIGEVQPLALSCVRSSTNFYRREEAIKVPMKETFAACPPGSVNDPEAVLNRSEKIVSETVIQPEKSHERSDQSPDEHNRSRN